MLLFAGSRETEVPLSGHVKTGHVPQRDLGTVLVLLCNSFGPGVVPSFVADGRRSGTLARQCHLGQYLAL